MKQITLFIIATCFLTFSVARAQIAKGKILVGISSGLNVSESIATGSDFVGLKFGSIKFKSNASGYEEPEPVKTTSINLLPSIGYFITNNLAVGLDLTLGMMNYKDGEDGDTEKMNILLAGPFIRYYFPMNNLYPFVAGSASFGSLKYKWESDQDSDEDKTALTSFGGGLGIAVPIGNKVTFDIMAGYTSITAKDKEDNPDDNRVVIGSFGLKFGFVIFLGNNE